MVSLMQLRAVRYVALCMTTFRSCSLFLLLAGAFVLSSCGSHFNKAWKTATTGPIANNSIEGPWVGSWLSRGNGHHGELKCVVQPDTRGNGDHTFLYHATWAGALSGNFESVHHVKQHGGEASFTADSHLGVYGQFHAEGTIKNGQFKATYRAAGDHGIFEMKRPGA